MQAEVIAVGTELLLGQSSDTNSGYVAGRLPALGIDLYWIGIVGDNQGRLVEALRRALARSDIVITTGGLGPTEDDITREAIAEAVGEELALDEALVDWLRGVFANRSWPMPQRNLRQAMRVPSAEALPNPRGTAPGWWLEKNGRIVVALPGPPAEMAGMWADLVEPRLRGRSGAVLVTRMIKTAGVGEATVDEMLSPLLDSTNPTLGIYAKSDGIHVRLTAKAADEAAGLTMLAPVEAEVRAIMGDSVWGADDDTIEGNLAAMLIERGQSIAVMESFTGGLLASTLTDVPGVSACFRGGIVAYDPSVKVAWGVDAALIEQHGVVSAEVAAAMAQAVRHRLDADYGLSTTGVAGPEPLEGKPVGTIYLGLAHPGGVEVSHQVLPPRRLLVKRRAVVAALMMLRRQLLRS